jgi:hypothetical protein
MILVDEHYLGEGRAFKRVFLIPFFFGFDLFGYLAFTVAMQLGPGFIDTISFVSLFISEIAQDNDAFAHGLNKERCDQ